VNEVELHLNDLPHAHELAWAWGVSPGLAKVGTMTPTDGVSFLLALFATYCRGSRFWTVPRGAGLLCQHSTWNLIVTDRDGIEHGAAMRVDVPHVVISIRDLGSRPVKAITNALCHGILSLAFHDAEPEDRVVSDLGVRLMTERQANSVWRFLQPRSDRIRAIVAHCEAGMSRSPALLIAIGEMVGADTRSLVDEFNPNRHVINTLRETFQKRRWLAPRRGRGFCKSSGALALRRKEFLSENMCPSRNP
jgi:predicted protein tyrosine phosphatase